MLPVSANTDRVDDLSNSGGLKCNRLRYFPFESGIDQTVQIDDVIVGLEQAFVVLFSIKHQANTYAACSMQSLPGLSVHLRRRTPCAARCSVALAWALSAAAAAGMMCGVILNTSKGSMDVNRRHARRETLQKQQVMAI